MQANYTSKSKTFPESSGIYRITCIVTGKFYVGSAVNLRKRQKDHRYHLNKGDHGSPKLQNAWNKHGKENFIFDILELVLIPEMLTAREQYWFSILKPFGARGFNTDRIAGSRLGSVVSPETRAKISKLNQGNTYRRGQKASPETIERLKVSHRGHKPSQPPPSMKGKRHRPESIEKMRIVKLGHTLSTDGRAKMIAGKTGHTYTPEVYASRMKTLIIIDPDGIEYTVTGIRSFCIAHDLDISCLMRVAKGTCRQHKGWTARPL